MNDPMIGGASISASSSSRFRSGSGGVRGPSGSPPPSSRRHQQLQHGRAASSDLPSSRGKQSHSPGASTSSTNASSNRSHKSRTSADTSLPGTVSGKATRNSTGSQASSNPNHASQIRHSQTPQRRIYTRSSTAPLLSSSERSTQAKPRRRSTSRDNDGSGGSRVSAGRTQAFGPTLSTVTAGLPISKEKHPSSGKDQIGGSFLIMDDDHEALQRSSDDIPNLDRETGDSSSRQTRNVGCTLEELVTRLLAQPLSKSDSNFAAIFLCLYRKFATPGELLEALLDRFKTLDQPESQQMIRISTQLRHLSILTQWVLGYPGDFAHPQVRLCLGEFIATLSHNRAFAVAAKEMRLQLEVDVEDEDAGWARSDLMPEKPESVDGLSRSLRTNSTASTLLPDVTLDDPTGEHDASDGKDADGMRKKPTRTSDAPSTSSSGGHSGKWSSGSFQTLLNSVESAEREAQKLVPYPRTPLTKVQWHQFMDMLDEDVAEEMTRIDWIMFSSIRPRDLVRHVSLNAKQKEKCKSLGNVNRMITHFNHVAYWVSSMIILRDKPKHRARALEKFMNIAWKLRQTNNYNSLGAVIAGINANAIYRLAQTRELVPHQTQRRFMRLEILMGTQKSHFAYRLAWENTSSGRIPFIPLHRRDLVSAEEGNRTFVDERKKHINWKKFEIMGEVIVGIQKSQGTPYLELERRADAQLLILDGLFMKDDEQLYNRSVQLEGPNAIPADSSRKKFPWFLR